MKKIEVVQINKGRPIPENYTSYPFDQLEVGDSFEFKLVKRASVQSRVTLLNKRGERQYVVRKVSDDIGGVWRVK